MNEAVKARLKLARPETLEAQSNLLREMIQEIALLGLWRAKFFEHAAFYGGTALRILRGLSRFSEDLDFSLLAPDPSFTILKYERALVRELESFGFDVEVVGKKKSTHSDIDSAFIKANTMIHLVRINSPLKTHHDANLRIKIEVDKDPPCSVDAEVVPVFWPIGFSVKSYAMPDLFAGKLHACLCRSQRVNIKGRDWFDFLWYVTRSVTVNLKHLQARMEQTGHWRHGEILRLEDLHGLLAHKIDSLDWQRVKLDVAPFLENPGDLDSWNSALFRAATLRVNGSP